jgi:cell division transport system ATP-binding protein
MEELVRYQGVDINRGSNHVLQSIQVEILKGEFIYLIGKVGSGKSTLIKSMYGEIPLKNGSATILGYDMHRIKRKDLPYLRRKLGVIFQDFQLLTDRNVHDNLAFVLKATGWKKKPEIEQRIKEVLTQVGLLNKDYKMPFELSGGEQQRVVIARALLNQPKLIIADEPTGNLDVETGAQIVKLLHSISQGGTAILMCTHNLSIIEKFPAKVLLCRDGAVTVVAESEKRKVEEEIKSAEEYK